MAGDQHAWPSRLCNSRSAARLDSQCRRFAQSGKDSHSTRECSGDNLIRRPPAFTAKHSCFLMGFPPRSLVLVFASAPTGRDELPDTGICAQKRRVSDPRCNPAIRDNQNLKWHPVAIAQVSHRSPTLNMAGLLPGEPAGRLAGDSAPLPCAGGAARFQWRWRPCTRRSRRPPRYCLSDAGTGDGYGSVDQRTILRRGPDFDTLTAPTVLISLHCTAQVRQTCLAGNPPRFRLSGAH